MYLYNEMFPFSDTRTHRESRVTPPIHPSPEYSQPIRSKLLHVDSRFATSSSGNETHEYLMDLPEPIHDIRRISVEEVDVPVAFFNISTSLQNNRIPFVHTTTSASSVVVITDGYYTAQSLATAVATQCNSAISGLTLVVSIDATMKITLTATDLPEDTSYYLQWGDPISTNQTSHTLGYILGFRTPRTLLEVSTPVQGTSPCFVNTVMPYLFLSVEDYTNSRQNQVSVALGGANSSAGPRGSTYLASDTILAKVTIPGTPAFGDRVVATTTTGYMTPGIRKYSPGTTIRRIGMTWMDVMGNPVSLNDVPFSVCFRVDCI